jgi:hypothetical protein
MTLDQQFDPTPRSARALKLHEADNVAVALEELVPGRVSVLGEPDGDCVTAAERIATGHKIALKPIGAEEAVLKFGVAIGYATAAIDAGHWVHTHNCRSRLDERSHTLDPHSGAATDTPYI